MPLNYYLAIASILYILYNSAHLIHQHVWKYTWPQKNQRLVNIKGPSKISKSYPIYTAVLKSIPSVSPTLMLSWIFYSFPDYCRSALDNCQFCSLSYSKIILWPVFRLLFPNTNYVFYFPLLKNLQRLTNAKNKKKKMYILLNRTKSPDPDFTQCLLFPLSFSALSWSPLTYLSGVPSILQSTLLSESCFLPSQQWVLTPGFLVYVTLNLPEDFAKSPTTQDWCLLISVIELSLCLYYGT